MLSEVASLVLSGLGGESAKLELLTPFPSSMTGLAWSRNC